MRLVTVYEGPPHSAEAVAGLLREQGLDVDFVPPAPYMAGPMLAARVRVADADRERAEDLLLHAELEAAEQGAPDRVGAGGTGIDDPEPWEFDVDDDEPMPPRIPGWVRWVAIALIVGWLLLRYF